MHVQARASLTGLQTNVHRAGAREFTLPPYMIPSLPVESSFLLPVSLLLLLFVLHPLPAPSIQPIFDIPLSCP